MLKKFTYNQLAFDSENNKKKIKLITNMLLIFLNVFNCLSIFRKLDITNKIHESIIKMQ